jgi:hypothetical protein
VSVGTTWVETPGLIGSGAVDVPLGRTNEMMCDESDVASWKTGAVIAICVLFRFSPEM